MLAEHKKQIQPNIHSPFRFTVLMLHSCKEKFYRADRGGLSVYMYLSLS